MKRLVTLYIPTSGEDRIPEGSRSIMVHEGYEDITNKIDYMFDIIRCNGIGKCTKCGGEYFKDHPDWIYYEIENS